MSMCPDADACCPWCTRGRAAGFIPVSERLKDQPQPMTPEQVCEGSLHAIQSPPAGIGR